MHPAELIAIVLRDAASRLEADAAPALRQELLRIADMAVEEGAVGHAGTGAAAGVMAPSWQVNVPSPPSPRLMRLMPAPSVVRSR